MSKKDKVIRINKDDFKPGQNPNLAEMLPGEENLASVQEYSREAQVGMLNRKINALLYDRVHLEFNLRAGKDMLLLMPDKESQEYKKAAEVVEQNQATRDVLNDRLRVYRQIRNEVKDKILEL